MEGSNTVADSIVVYTFDRNPINIGIKNDIGSGEDNDCGSRGIAYFDGHLLTECRESGLDLLGLSRVFGI